jgi:DNA polymerase-3 subunit epsilon
VRNLSLDRSLVVFDLETTGTDPAKDRIVEIGILRIEPDGTRDSRTRLINPEVPIPHEATEVHGISDEDVHEAPTFRRIARSLLEFLEGADLAGFNVRRFDIPLLEREFRDCGMDLGLSERRVVDVMTIYHRKERRDLSAAVQFYLEREHEGAHGAEADLLATWEVLEAQLERYDDLPLTVSELDQWTRPRQDAVDQMGKFAWKKGDVVFAFGKYNGQSLREVAQQAPDYLRWILGTDFPSDAREIVRLALEGEYPAPPTPTQSA